MAVCKANGIYRQKYQKYFNLQNSLPPTKHNDVMLNESRLQVERNEESHLFIDACCLEYT